MYVVITSNAARHDIEISSEWYDEQLPGLSTKFQKEIFTTLRYIERNPLLYAVRFSGKFHFAKVSQFPFLIIYEIVGTQILVNAVFHTSRKPSKF